MPYLVLKKVVREHIDLRADKSGKTFGQLIDKAIGEAMDTNGEIAEINFGFEGDEWHNFCITDEADEYRSASGVSSGRAHKAKAVPSAY